MASTFPGDEWKQADSKPTVFHPTRAQEQARIDQRFGDGRMSPAEWSKRFDELSSVEKWTKEGKVTV